MGCGTRRRTLPEPLLFKAALFALLAANTAYFACGDSLSRAIDALAWLTLLALFHAETARASRRALVRWARLAAAAGVFAATVGYVFEGNVLDAVNSVLWILVVAMLEIQMRYAHAARRLRMAFSVLAVVLYGALALLVVVWALRGMWFDAYDALLWLTAFAAIELDLIKRKVSTQNAATAY